MKQTFKKILLFLLVTSSLHSSVNSHAKDIDTTIKSGLSIFKTPFRSDVYLYNTITKGEPGHELKILFGEPQNSGKPLDQSTYWPETGAVITSFGPDADNRQSGITKIATLSRYSGIEAGTTYEFTQTIQLPGINGNANSQLQLKQRIVGTGLGTKVFIGLQLPGEKQTQWFDDYQWHHAYVKNVDRYSGDTLGTYHISCCFDHSKTVTHLGNIKNDPWDTTKKIAGISTGVAALSGAANIADTKRIMMIHKLKEEEEESRPLLSVFYDLPERTDKRYNDFMISLGVMGNFLNKSFPAFDVRAMSRCLIDTQEKEQIILKALQNKEMPTTNTENIDPNMWNALSDRKEITSTFFV